MVVGVLVLLFLGVATDTSGTTLVVTSGFASISAGGAPVPERTIFVPPRAERLPEPTLGTTTAGAGVADLAV